VRIKGFLEIWWLARLIEGKSLRWVFVIFVLAFLTLYSFSGYILDFQNADAAIYGDVAKNVLEKNSLETKFIWASWFTYSRTGTLPLTVRWRDTPLYVYVVALFFRVFGASFWTMKLVGVTFAALLVIPTFSLTKTAFGKGEAIIAAILSFAFPLLIVNSIIPGDKIFVAFLIMSALCFLSQNMKIHSALIAGFSTGLTFLARIDFGGTLFATALVFYALGAASRRANLKKRLLIGGVFIASFGCTVVPWLVSNYQTFGFFLRFSGVVASTFFGTTIFDVSPNYFFSGMGVIFIFYLFVSVLSPKIMRLARRCVPRNKKYVFALFFGVFVISFFVFVLRTEWLIFVLSVISTYPQIIYQSSPLIFILAIVGAARGIGKLDVVHPAYTFPVVIILLYSAMLGSEVKLGASYIIPYLPILMIFVASSVFEIVNALSGVSILSNAFRFPKVVSSLSVLFTTRNLMLTLLVGSIFLSLMPQYSIIIKAENIHQGPFLKDNWNKAVEWVLSNTDKDDTIIARFPVLTFYTGRRTVVLEPFDFTQLLAIITASGASYLIVDNTAYLESLNLVDSPIVWLHDYSQSFPGFDLVYQVENPRLQIFNVSKPPVDYSSLIGWADESFASGWTVDSGLTFRSDGNFVEMAYNNTGTSPAFLYAAKNLFSPVRSSDYPFLIIRYRFKYWTKAGYPPPGYLRVEITDSAGNVYGSDKTPYPSDDKDYGWHIFRWQLTEVADVAKLALMLRVGEGTNLSVVIDHVVLSKWPVYIKG